MKARLAGFAIAFAACFGVGYWLALTAAPKTDRRPAAQAKSTQSALVAQREELPKTKSARPNRESEGDQAARDMGAFEGERVLSFRDAESMARFLERAAGKLRIISRLDALRALRVGFANRADFERLLDGSETESYVFPVLIPGLPEGSGLRIEGSSVALVGRAECRLFRGTQPPRDAKADEDLSFLERGPAS